MNRLKTLTVPSREQWRTWLWKHHADTKEIWLIYYKKRSGKCTLNHEEALDEALCFGWIDSLVRRIDDVRYAQKFTPRKAESKWSEQNRKRAYRLIREGRMEDAGRSAMTFTRRGTPGANRVDVGLRVALPAFMKGKLKANAQAWRNFEALAPSYRRLYIRWITAAKREETRMRRLWQAMDLLERNQKMGLK
jgi:uncharacterized protein YdeI (YjbR/CyaY-like superfamily)